MAWNFNIDEAPRDEKIIVSTKCGKVTVSRYLPSEKRWEMLGKDEQPISWQPWPEWSGFKEEVSGGQVSQG